MGVVLRLMPTEFHGLPLDHSSITIARGVCDRAANMHVVKTWLVDGPYKDDEEDVFYFILQNSQFSCMKRLTIPESDFLWNEQAVKDFVGKLVTYMKDMEIANHVGMELTGTPEAQLSNDEILQRSTGVEIVISSKQIRLTPLAKKQEKGSSLIQVATK